MLRIGQDWYDIRLISGPVVLFSAVLKLSTKEADVQQVILDNRTQMKKARRTELGKRPNFTRQQKSGGWWKHYQMIKCNFIITDVDAWSFKILLICNLRWWDWRLIHDWFGAHVCGWDVGGGPPGVKLLETSPIGGTSLLGNWMALFSGWKFPRKSGDFRFGRFRAVHLYTYIRIISVDLNGFFLS